MKRKSGNIEDIKFDYKTQHGQAAIGNPIPLRRSNQTSSFWVDRNLQKEAAIQHTKDMEEQFRDRIVYSRENTKLYDVDWKCLPTAKGQHIPSLDVVNIDSVSAIFRYAEAGKKTVVLNLANYKKAGGMFIQGSRSKEEEYLCHDSYLYNVLTAFPEYYDWNRQHTNRSLYLNRALYSPDIYFFQDGHKVLCDVITCAAPNRAAALKYHGVSNEENLDAVTSRIRFILEIAETQKVDTLILGAFGADVLGQKGMEVVKIFRDILRKNGWSFQKVIFAIPDYRRYGNYNKFRKVIKEK